MESGWEDKGDGLMVLGACGRMGSRREKKEPVEGEEAKEGGTTTLIWIGGDTLTKRSRSPRRSTVEASNKVLSTERKPGAVKSTFRILTVLAEEGEVCV